MPAKEMTKEETEQTEKILNSPSHKAAEAFIKIVCANPLDEDVYAIRYFDFMAGFNKGAQSTLTLTSRIELLEAEAKETRYQYEHDVLAIDSLQKRIEQLEKSLQGIADYADEWNMPSIKLLATNALKDENR